MTAQATAVDAAGSGGALVTTPCTFRGYSITSTAGADVAIYDNASAGSGVELARFTLAAKGHLAFDIDGGVRCLNGVYITATAAITGHVRIS